MRRTDPTTERRPSDPTALVNGTLRVDHEPADAGALFAAVFGQALVGVAIADLEGRLHRINAAYCRITGYAQAELLGTDLLAITHPEDRDSHREDLRGLIRGDTSSCVIHKRYLSKHGRVVWVQNSVSIARDALGAPCRLVLLTEDITARRQAELLLEEEHAWLTLALGAAQMGIWEWNFSTGERRWNDAMYGLYGVDRAHVKKLAPPYIEEILPEDSGRVQREIRRLRAKAGTAQVEFRIRRQDNGEIRWISSRGTMRRDEQGAERMLGVSYDITERKAAEHKLIEADRRKDEFLAMLAHELRNPLAPLTNAHRLLQRSASLTEHDQTVLAMAGRQTAQLKRLIDDLLEVSRITRGKIELRCEPMTVATAIYNAVESVAPAFQERRHRLRVIVPDEPVRIVADSARVAQVLENLLNNACKYTPEGGEVRLEVDHGPQEIEIRVVDNGTGIDPAKIGQIFELFAQIDTTIDRAQGGLGIGLALVRSLVGLHGGSVHAFSAGKGRGTTFTVRMPRTGPQMAGAPAEGAC